ncbi:golgin subfamily A member 6-like protein 6 [Polypterus senegalus]|uniref:golgin subfamily A member 6-like protein 6 n=1 Tax=Polypterus senegalus TaxID=55291 RepID=UPI001964FB23|nr:golgin subfamily A member 6-like protein 6 [Polypterus senegalus]
MQAAMNGNVEALQLLLMRGADTAIKDWMGRTASDYAQMNKQDECLQLIMDHERESGFPSSCSLIRSPAQEQKASPAKGKKMEMENESNEQVELSRSNLELEMKKELVKRRKESRLRETAEIVGSSDRSLNKSQHCNNPLEKENQHLQEKTQHLKQKLVESEEQRIRAESTIQALKIALDEKEEEMMAFPSSSRGTEDVWRLELQLQKLEAAERKYSRMAEMLQLKVEESEVLEKWKQRVTQLEAKIQELNQAVITRDKNLMSASHDQPLISTAIEDRLMKLEDLITRHEMSNKKPQKRAENLQPEM